MSEATGPAVCVRWNGAPTEDSERICRSMERVIGALMEPLRADFLTIPEPYQERTLRDLPHVIRLTGKVEMPRPLTSCPRCGGERAYCVGNYGVCLECDGALPQFMMAGRLV